MKQWAAVITLITFILAITVLSGAAIADNRKEQATCVKDKLITQSVQFVRITTHDDWETYKANVVKWSKPGQAMGEAKTEQQIAIKDAFWKRNLYLAELVYSLPVGWSPEYVGNYFLGLCQWKFELRRQKENSVQKYDV